LVYTIFGKARERILSGRKLAETGAADRTGVVHRALGEVFYRFAA